jgi:hypothetical protein
VYAGEEPLNRIMATWQFLCVPTMERHTTPSPPPAAAAAAAPSVMAGK